MISSPTLILDIKKARKNIRNMAGKARRLNLELRPHFKTHQSKEIGNWFREEGIHGITVSSVKMAEYFAADNWRSITIAFPVSILESNRLSELANQKDIRILATEISVLEFLNKSISNEIGVYIELDPGYQRSGIPILEFNKLRELKSFIISSENLRFDGFYTHAGHSYKCRSAVEIKNLSSPIIKNLTKLKSEFGDPICFGDTPSCSVLDDFGSIDQISPGNFVFYDWTQVNIGSCDVDEIAIAMYCPVVAKYPKRNELLIHGGAVYFSKDSFTNDLGVPYFGVITEKKENGWGNVIDGVILKSISQEHGIVKCTPSYYDEVEIGDIIPILPIHSCLTADLMGKYVTLDEKILDHLSVKRFE